MRVDQFNFDDLALEFHGLLHVELCGEAVVGPDMRAGPLESVGLFRKLSRAET